MNSEIITYSQAGQDKWVLSLFPKGFKGFFLDLGCNDPKKINNTLLLEENGWDGISVDIFDFSKQWKSRNTPFICRDALSYVKNSELIKVIDYVSIDIDLLGTNYEVLKTIIDKGIECKSITIEHNLYIGEEYNQRERVPQRELLFGKGHVLRYPDVMVDDGLFNKFEDWWINPKYIIL